MALLSLAALLPAARIVECTELDPVAPPDYPSRCWKGNSMFFNLRVEKALLENILTNLPAGVLICDEGFTIMDASCLALDVLCE